jgi:ABC-2 type transport system ATP-binding protein
VEIPQFYPYLTGRKNLELLYGLSGGRDRARVDACLERVGLGARGGDPVRAYSQGMRQRLGLAQALLTRPELVILDEPTNGLDPQGILDMRALIRGLNRDEGVTFLVSSHLLHEIEITCNRVAIVHRGRLKVEDEVAKLLAGAGAVARVRAEPVDRARQVAAALGCTVTGEDRGALLVTGGDTGLDGLAAELVRAGCRLHELTPGRASLEDYFLRATSGDSHAA